uniref:Putative na+iodide/myo-inositol/multivitamin symporter n=1 Tax=Ixodes ricinus TaxID=34613 RepID=A0A6B0VB20_IXORI
MAMSTIFHFPFLWSCLAIGLTGTVYTTLGGLRGVVWTDCMQALVTILVPITLVIKTMYDSQSEVFKPRPLSDFDVGTYALDTTLDFTKDENIWSCLIGALSLHMYRSGMDQMVVQRYMASRTLEDAKWTAGVGMTLFSLSYMSLTGIGILLIYWFRDCDPLLSGSIKQLDQILPFYVKKNFADFPGFSGLFLAGVVSAATSTISSIINSQAAVLYTDVVSQYFTLTELQATRVTRCLAFAAGIAMTLYSAAIPYLGSASRIFMMVNSAVTGPFVGLFLMALIFPCVNSKGAGAATVLAITFQFWLMYNKLFRDVRPQRIPVTLDNCPGNHTALLPKTNNATFVPTPNVPQDLFILLRLSSYWSNSISTILTILLGLAISAVTGGLKTSSKMERLTSDVFLRLWRWMKLMSPANDAVHVSSDGRLRNEDSNGFNPEEMLKLTNETKV